MRLALGGLALTAAVVMLVVLAGPAASRADVPVETVGRVEALPQPPGDHWVWISDVMLRRSALLDVDRGAFLGMVSAGFLSPTLFSSQTGSELYLPETVVVLRIDQEWLAERNRCDGIDARYRHRHLGY